MKKILIVLCVLAFSCNEDRFLTVDPQGQKKSEDFFKTAKHAEEATNAMYGFLKSWDISGFNHIAITSITSDDAIRGSVPGDAGFLDEMDQFTFTPTHQMINEYWRGQYQGVNLANQVLENVPAIPMLDGVKAQYLAEAKFIRAFHYFNLVRAFGGVPLIIRLPKDPEEINPPRKTKEEVYAQIEKDLTEAAGVLPVNYSADLGRATKGAALGMLAKVKLYQKKYADALSLSEQVMTLGYKLVSDYNGMFRVSGENKEESLFEVQAGIFNGDCGGYCQLSEIQAPRNMWGWGFNEPTESLDRSFESGDLRREATILFKGETTPEGDKILESVPNPRYNQKMYVPTSEPNACGWGYGRAQNRRVLRFAEILLIHAEAANETGNSTKALESVNKIRNRAGLKPLSTTTKEDLKTKIWAEKHAELAMEEDRFFEIVRQGTAGNILRAQGKKFVDGKHEVFPIPQVQIELSANKLAQNPNY